MGGLIEIRLAHVRTRHLEMMDTRVRMAIQVWLVGTTEHENKRKSMCGDEGRTGG